MICLELAGSCLVTRLADSTDIAVEDCEEAINF